MEDSLTVPPECQSIMCTDFEATNELNECSLGVLEGDSHMYIICDLSIIWPSVSGLVSQMIEGVASEADYFLSFQTLLLPGDPIVFRLALYFSTNFFDKLTADNLWLSHIHELSATVMLSLTSLSLVFAYFRPPKQCSSVSLTRYSVDC